MYGINLTQKSLLCLNQASSCRIFRLPLPISNQLSFSPFLLANRDVFETVNEAALRTPEGNEAYHINTA